MTTSIERLLIISHTPHYLRTGQVVGWGATIREIDQLAERYREIRHIACLHRQPAPEGALPYASDRVRLVPVPPAGGETVREKLSLLRALPVYVHSILRELRWADAVHVRCPASISLLAVLLLTMVRHPRVRWIKYAGNWRPNGAEPPSYTFQRRLLSSKLHRGQVSVNGRWPVQPPHVHSFLNPCLTDAELLRARRRAENKSLTLPVRLLFVGRVEEAKGVGRALEIVDILRRWGVDARLDIVGGGPELSMFREAAAKLAASDRVTFHGWLPRAVIDQLYAASHILLLPSRSSEGWPKVLSEAMAFGVVPLAGTISSIPQYLAEFRTGGTHPPGDVERFATSVADYVADPDQWRVHSVNARRAAGQFTYTRYLDSVREVLGSDPVDAVDAVAQGAIRSIHDHADEAL